MLEWFSSDLDGFDLQITHQLKDWLPLPPTHLPAAFPTNSCQRTPSSQAPTNTCVCVCALPLALFTHQVTSVLFAVSLTGSAKSCQPLILCNGVHTTMLRPFLTHLWYIRSLCRGRQSDVVHQSLIGSSPVSLCEQPRRELWSAYYAGRGACLAN